MSKALLPFLFCLSIFQVKAQVCNFSYSLGADTSFCPGSTFNFLLNAPANKSPYLWDNGSTAAVRVINNFGTYFCRATEIGASVVNNGDFSAGNSGFTSDYSIGTGGTWGPISLEGTYVVVSNTSLAHNNFTPFGNHTPGGGNMMVVNGASIANVSVWCQNIVVSPNTNYSFSTWITSCESGQPASQLAKLQFSINGVPLFLNGSTTVNTFSPTAVANSWVEFAASWNSGASTTASICIVNQNTTTAGNDFALDDISFRPICQYTDTFKVTTKPLPTLVDAGINDTICAGDSINLNGNQGTGTSLAWTSIPVGFNSTITQPKVSPALTTLYILNSTLDGCVQKDTVAVQVNALPTADFDMTTIDSTCSSYGVSLVNLSTSASSYLWEFGDGTSSTDTNVIHNFGQSGNLEIKLTAFNGACAATATEPVKILFGSKSFTLPNIFTPNGDANNDRFFVPKECIQSANVAIYNRWGKLVKEWEGTEGFWDGKIKGNDAEDGVYYYVVEAAYANGETTRFNGTLSLYR